ncbi:homoprotocatechuate degradation operon regulator HpaR [Teredinibacter turnerae]|uniref:Homoprotocatechuate degradation operon regulator, HpaR n=1 Tax=Teredinibacter turnerae (strain ATCC 39867 / T7901) TaxID=377629 RepID=C5BTL1_TERTT|nr:homoprotocatechuate degradation operon regulator HpaR [Teredinibacter turnerae]ACR12424.1 homoprotocatechuate degradation operon regulator, HpaR [Teredinibacter turnerae T7901]
MTVTHDNLPLLLLKARESSVACIRAVLSDASLTEQQWRVIRTLALAGELNAQDLANQSCILSPSLSRILARLEADKIIIRKVDATDQRALNLKLSAKGKRLHDRLAPRVDKQYQMLVKEAGKDTIVKLASLLEKFNTSTTPAAENG